MKHEVLLGILVIGAVAAIVDIEQPPPTVAYEDIHKEHEFDEHAARRLLLAMIENAQREQSGSSRFSGWGSNYYSPIPHYRIRPRPLYKYEHKHLPGAEQPESRRSICKGGRCHFVHNDKFKHLPADSYADDIRGFVPPPTDPEEFDPENRVNNCQGRKCQSRRFSAQFFDAPQFGAAPRLSVGYNGAVHHSICKGGQCHYVHRQSRFQRSTAKDEMATSSGNTENEAEMPADFSRFATVEDLHVHMENMHSGFPNSINHPRNRLNPLNILGKEEPQIQRTQIFEHNPNGHENDEPEYDQSLAERITNDDDDE